MHSPKTVKRSRFIKKSSCIHGAIEKFEPRVLFSAFQPGDVVVYRVGTGAAALSSASTAVFIDEYTPSGTLVQSIALPTTASGSNNPLTASGTATSEGNLTLSQNGQSLLLTGYDAGTGVASIASTNTTTTGTITRATAASPSVLTTASTLGMTNGDVISVSGVGGITFSPAQSTYFVKVVSSTTFSLFADAALTVPVSGSGTYTSGGAWIDNSLIPVPRDVGVLSPTGTINTTTTLGSALDNSNIRGAASDGTSGIWATGSNGTVFTTEGSTATPTILATSNDRSIEIINNQVYVTSGTGTAALLGTLGTGLPTSGGPLTITQLSGIVGSGTSGAGLGGAFEFAFATLNGGTTPDTLYVADNFNDGVDKFSLVNGSWVLNGEIGAFASGGANVLAGISGIVAEPTTGGEQLFISSAGSSGTAGTLYTITDPYGYNSAGGSIGTAAGGIFSANPPLTALATAATNEAFRGIGFVPQSTLTITAQPTSQVGAVGGTAKFFAAVAPGTNETVQWQINTNDGTGFNNIPGATSDTLTVSGLATSQSGFQYRAVFNSAAGSVTTNTVTLTVQNVPLFNIDSGSYSVNENIASGVATITVDRAGNTSVAGSVNYATSNGTAIAGTNYTNTSGTLNFAAGVTQQTFTVLISNVSPQGGDKFFNVTLSSPASGGLLGTTATATVTIVDTQEIFSLSSATDTVNDTDGTAVVSVVRTGPFIADAATVPISVSGAFTASGTATFAAGQLVAAASFPITASSANQSITVSLGQPATFTGFTGTPALGATTSAAETIVHVQAPANTSTISGVAASVTDIETSGPFAQSFAPVVGDKNAGTSSFGFLSYEVLEYSPPTTPSLYPVPGTTVNSGGLSNLSLQLFNTDAGTDNFGGHPGNFNVYFIPDSDATTATSKLTFSTTAVPPGLASTQFKSAPILLGTFSFNNTAGYDTYTPASIPSAVETALVSDLNSGSNFRLAVTPQTSGKGAIAADWRGIFSGQTPVLSFSAAETVNQTLESIAFQSASYSVSESGGAATITLTRAGVNISDTATVNYATSDGTAIAGTNYTATSGTATFAAGSATTSFTVPLNNVSNQGGDKVLNLSLSSPATGSPTTTVAVLASPSTASLTILDSSTAGTETLSSSIIDAGDIETKGPFDDTELKATAVSGDFPSYSAVDFTASAPTNPVTAIDGITMTLTNEPTVAAGPVNFYLVSDTTSNILPSSPQSTNPHFYDSTQGIEGFGSQFGTAMLLGRYNLTDTTGGDTLTIPLTGYSAATESAFISYLNAASSPGNVFRILITPGNSTVDADWVAGSAAISVKVQEATSSAVTVTSVVVDGNNPALAGAQRSMVNSIVYSFNQAVTLATANAFSIALHASQTGTLPTLNWAAISPDASGASTQWVVTFSGAGVTGGSIGDGVYDITLNVAAVTSESNPAASVTPRATDTFYRLYGDAQGTGKVNTSDYGAFLTTFGLKSSAAGYLAYFADDGSGKIDTSDYGAFLANFGKKLSGFTATI